MTAIDSTPAGPQHVLPGAERAGDATMVRLAAAKPLRPRIPQAPCDIGLFSDDAVFYAERVLADSFGMRGAGWCWWSCRRGCLPDCPPVGPFPTSYRAYRDALGSFKWPQRRTHSEKRRV